MKNVPELLDVALWAEVMPIIGQEPLEFQENKSIDGKSTILARQWTFVNVNSFRDVQFRSVKVKSTECMVSQIGKYIST